MSETREQAEFRRHLGELRRAASGLGRDFGTEISQLDTKIERMGSVTARDARILGRDIEEDLASLAGSIGEEARRLPHRIADAGSALGSGTARAALAAKDAMVSAGKKAKTGTQNVLATAAGVRRTPMKSWSPPATDEPVEEPKGGSGSG